MHLRPGHIPFSKTPSYIRYSYIYRLISVPLRVSDSPPKHLFKIFPLADQHISLKYYDYMNFKLNKLAG